jgi:prepilin peptidase CpaA
MNLVPGSPLWLLIPLFLALAAAAIEDFIRLRISNLTCLAVLVMAIVAAFLQGFSPDLWQNVVVFAALLGAGFLLFAFGKMGGGDVKLLACLGLWVNINDGIWLLASTLIAGGILAFIYIAVRWGKATREGKKYKSKGIPYGLAIAAGAVLVFTSQMGLLKSQPTQPNIIEYQPL